MTRSSTPDVSTEDSYFWKIHYGSDDGSCPRCGLFRAGNQLQLYPGCPMCGLHLTGRGIRCPMGVVHVFAASPNTREQRFLYNDFASLREALQRLQDNSVPASCVVFTIPAPDGSWQPIHWRPALPVYLKDSRS